MKSEEFYRYISDVPLPAVVTAAVLLTGAGYAACCGFETLSRTAQVVFWLFAASVFLLFVSNAGGMRITNLEWQTAPWKDSVPSAIQGFSLSAEWLLFFDDGARGPARRLKSAGRNFGKTVCSVLRPVHSFRVGAWQRGRSTASRRRTLARLGPVGVPPL